MPTELLDSLTPETPSTISLLASAIEKITTLQGLSVEDREWLARRKAHEP